MLSASKIKKLRKKMEKVQMEYFDIRRQLDENEHETKTFYSSKSVVEAEKKYYAVFLRDTDTYAEMESKKENLIRFVRSVVDRNASEEDIEYFKKTPTHQKMLVYTISSSLSGNNLNPLIYKNIEVID